MDLIIFSRSLARLARLGAEKTICSSDCRLTKSRDKPHLLSLIGLVSLMAYADMLALPEGAIESLTDGLPPPTADGRPPPTTDSLPPPKFMEEKAKSKLPGATDLRVDALRVVIEFFNLDKELRHKKTIKIVKIKTLNYFII